jgi:hypothetical protein
MVSVQVQLGEPVVLVGQRIHASIVFTSTSTEPSTIAWASAVVRCMATLPATPKPPQSTAASPYAFQPPKGMPPCTPSMHATAMMLCAHTGEAGLCVFQSVPEVLACDLLLLPGQSATRSPFARMRFALLKRT